MGHCHSKPKGTVEERLRQMQIPIVWVIGSPGSGRTTQCDKLVERYLFWKVCIPQIIEDRVHHIWSTRGRALRAILQRNELIPREFLLDMVREDMMPYIDRSSGYLLDGFPRNIDQADRFAEATVPPKLILHLTCTIATAKKRLREKYPGHCSVAESDDSVHRRMQVFYSHVGPILDKYKEQVVEIDANGSPGAVNKECRRHIEKLFAQLGIQVPSSKNEEQVYGEDGGESSEDEDDW